VRSLSGQELAAAQQRFAEAQYGLLQHYSNGLATSMRIKWNDNGTVRPLWDGLKLIGWERVS